MKTQTHTWIEWETIKLRRKSEKAPASKILKEISQREHNTAIAVTLPERTGSGTVMEKSPSLVLLTARRCFLRIQEADSRFE